MKKLLLYTFLFLAYTNSPLFAEGGNYLVLSELTVNEECSDLIVQLERDCTLAEETGVYVLNVTVLSGIPPFTLSGSINETLEELGTTSTIITDGIFYEISVIDAAEEEFYEKGGYSPCIGNPVILLNSIDEIVTCICGGNMVFNFEGIVEDSETLSVEGSWSTNGGNSYDFEIIDTIPQDAYFAINGILTESITHGIVVGDDFEYLEGYVSDFCNPENYTLEALDDFAATYPNESVIFNLLANDTGTNLQINQIFMPPSCGEILDINPETGVGVYLADADTECTVDSFVYEVIDECGNLAEATVTVFIEQEDDFIVQVERDCTNIEQTGTYTLNVGILGGVPPFTISGSINEVLEGGFPILTSTEITDGQPYEITVMDADGAEFHTTGGETACPNSPCESILIESIDEIAICLCNGDMVFAFDAVANIDSLIGIEGYWYDGTSKEIEVGETIPSDASFEIYTLFTNDYCYTIYLNGSPYIFGYVSDFCNPEDYTIEAINDFATTPSGEPTTINVLQNDSGTELQISQILISPTCGEILEVNTETGEVVYFPDADTGCITDYFVYEVEDACGNITMARVDILIPFYDDLIIQIQKDCSGAESTARYTLSIFILGGQPPFTISGSINEIMENFGTTYTTIDDGVPYEIFVVDAAGNEFYEFGGEFPCTGGCVILPITSEDVDEMVNCLCNGDMVFNFEDFFEEDTVTSINGYWHNDIEEGYLQVGDTISSDSYFSINELHTTKECYELYGFGFGGYTSDFCPAPCIEANLDLTTTSPTEPIAFNVLENDLGEGIFIKQIAKPPFCGIVEIIDAAMGILQYTPDNSCLSNPVNFEYQIEDIDGNRAIGAVKVVIKDEGNDLAVAVERDCCAGDWLIDLYPLTIYIVDGVPPFTVSGTINQIMDSVGIMSYEISGYEPYEIAVQDAVGNEFFAEGGEIACDKLCSEIEVYTDYVVEEGFLDCLCNGSLIVSFTPLAKYEEIQSIYGFWYLDNQPHPIEWGDTIPNNAYFEIFEVQTDYANYLVFTEKEGFLGGNTSDFCPAPCIEAHTDITTTSPTESITFNVLENDLGEGIFIQKITTQPLCGQVEIVDAELGTLRYTPDKGCLLKIINFGYRIEDVEQNTANAIVKVVVNRSENELVAGVEIDCTHSEETGIYSLLVSVIEGASPFNVTINNYNFIDSTGVFTFIVAEGNPFEISIVDATGKEFYEFGADAACHTFGPQARLHHIEQIGTCTCEGSLIVDFEKLDIGEEIIEGITGHWLDNDGNTIGIGMGDTIPPHRFFRISHIETDIWGYILLTKDILKSPQGFASDFCNPENYTLEAIDDAANTQPGDSTTINILQNDTGTELQINQILSSPSCGQIIDFNVETGNILYVADVNTDCFIDNFIVQVIDNCGNLTESLVTIFIEQEVDLNVIVEKDCTSICETGLAALSVAIFGGTPPYIVSGTITDTLETAGVIFAFIEDGEPYEINVVDGDNNQFSQTGGSIPCNFNCCEEIEVESTDGIVECLCDGSAILTLENILNIDTISLIEAYWHSDTDGEYLQNGDTIPANSILEVPFAYNEFDCYNIIYNDNILLVNISEFCASTPTCIEAIDDFYTVNSGESIIANPQENDLGEGITFIGILGGEEYGTVDIAVDGEISEWVYVANNNASCVTEQYEYIIEDAFGQRDTAMVEFYIKATYMDVHIDMNPYRACDNIQLLIANGCPPYSITGDIDTILQNQESMLGFMHPIGEDFNILIEDNGGNSHQINEPFDCNDCPFIPACNPDCENVDIEVGEIQQLCNGNGAIKIEFLDITGGSGNYDIIIEPSWGLFIGGYFNATIIDDNDCYALYSGSISNCQLIAKDTTISTFTNKALSFAFPQQDYWAIPNQIRLTDVETPSNGSIEWIPEGIITYTPAPHFAGSESFTYTIRDESSGAEQTANISIEVISVICNELELEYELGCTIPFYNEAGIQIDSIINGEAPFQASFNDNEFINFVPHQALNQLLVGNNTVLVQDANGCLSDTLELEITPAPDFTVSLQAPIENQIAILQVEPVHDFNAPFQVSFNSEAYQDAGKYVFEIDTLETPEFIVRIKDSNECESDAFYYAFRNLILVDIDEISSNIPNIQLFPNPNKGNFTLSLQLQQAETVNMEVFNALGQVKVRRRLKNTATLERHYFNLDLNSGLYFLQVSGKDWIWTEKIVVE